MIYEKVFFDETDENAYLEVYVADKIGDFVRNAILVIPGGGYGCVCSDREGEPIAHAFIPEGYNSFVLHYSVDGKSFPSHLIQASRAMKHIRDNAERYNINPDKLFVVGFSAGGHLAASLGTMWHKNEIYKEIDMPYGYNAPNGMMLIYPVISAKYHEFTFKNLLKAKSDEEYKVNSSLCSIENCVSEKTCPAFIVHTSNDEVVDVRNSLTLADSLAKNGIEFEMHIYPDAPHGVALGNAITKIGVEKFSDRAISEWIRHAVYWAAKL